MDGRACSAGSSSLALVFSPHDSIQSQHVFDVILTSPRKTRGLAAGSQRWYKNRLVCWFALGHERTERNDETTIHSSHNDVHILPARVVRRMQQVNRSGDGNSPPIYTAGASQSASVHECRLRPRAVRRSRADTGVYRSREPVLAHPARWNTIRGR